MSFRTINLFIAAIVLMTSVAVIYILVPDEKWNQTSYFSAFIFTLSLSLLTLLPIGKSRDSKIGLLGPYGVFISLFLVSSFSIFVVSLGFPGKLAEVLVIINTALGIVGALFLAASGKIIQRNLAQSELPSFQSRLVSEINALSRISKNNAIRSSLERLAEDMRFLPRDVIDSDKQYQADVMRNITLIRDSLEKDDIELINSNLDEFSNSIKAYEDSVKMNKSHA